MENANPFVPIPPNGLSVRISQELDEICAILAIIDSLLENIDHTHIIIPPHVPFEQLLNDFMNPPNVFEMDDLESENELVDTPLVSPFIDSVEESNDGEVLDESNEYGNAGNFYRNRRINSDGCDLEFHKFFQEIINGLFRRNFSGKQKCKTCQMLLTASGLTPKSVSTVAVEKSALFEF
ncbi:hypothetical protein Tco_0389547 [Tanacetum coccineum]